MKKNLYLMSALLAAGTLGFTSCSSELEQTAPVNPTYNEAENTVKTQFAFNVPVAVAGTGGTRMSNQIVQENFQFNGMKNIFLASLTGAPTPAASAYTSVYRLPVINTQAADQNGIQKIYEDVAVPVGTKHFILWAESNASGDPAVTGVLKNNINLNSVMSNAAVEFNLDKIVPAGISESNEAKKLIGAVNTVVTKNNADAKNWWHLKAAIEDPSATGIKAGEQLIVRLMEALCINDRRWNASHEAVNNILNDLTTALTAISEGELNSDATTGSKINSKSLRDEMLTEINNQLTEIGSIAANFPENLGLPQGAAVMQYNEADKGFEFANISSSPITGEDYLDAASLCFPPSLNYMVSTELKANTAKQTSWPVGVNNWQSATWSGWGDEVQLTTQAIALVQNINYSVARLDVNVAVKSAVSLDDNTMTGTTPTPSHIPSNLFTVTGIAIGGQPVAADWEVLPKVNDAFSNTVWDNQVPNTNKITETAQEFCKTLVLDNKVNSASTTPEQKTVIIALEIMNGSGADFRGYNGVIKAGAKFYMIAALDPGQGTKPAGISAEEEAKLDHVFVKDHVTKVTLTMNSLKNAYIGIPDLRSTDLQLGLSVDLKWEKGLEFNLDIE